MTKKMLSTKEACEVAGTTKELLFAISERENLGPDGMRAVDKNGKNAPVCYWHQKTAEAIRDVLAADVAKVNALVEANPGRYAPGGFRLTEDGRLQPIPITDALANLETEQARRGETKKGAKR